MPYKDPDRARAYGREWMKRNPEKAREAMRRWRKAHPEAHAAEVRAYNERNAERVRARYARYQKANPDLRRAMEQTRRARLAGTAGRFTAQEWRALVLAHQGRCAYCGVLPARLEADHRVPIARGGSGSIENILPACGPCNWRKGTRTESEFREWLAARKRR